MLNLKSPQEEEKNDLFIDVYLEYFSKMDFSFVFFLSDIFIRLLFWAYLNSVIKNINFTKSYIFFFWSLFHPQCVSNRELKGYSET